MHFGKSLLKQRYEAWADNYLDYNRLKTVLETEQPALALQQQQQTNTDEQQLILPKVSSHNNNHTNALDHHSMSSAALSESIADVHWLTKVFIQEFDKEVERVVYFYLQQQGLLATELQQIQNQAVGLVDSELELGGDDDDKDEDEESGIYKQLRFLGIKLLRLIEFVDLNVTAIRKILKKHDKIIVHHATTTTAKQQQQRRQKKNLSAQYLGTPPSTPVLAPLFEHGGLDCLFQRLADTFQKLPPSVLVFHNIVANDELPALPYYGTTTTGGAADDPSLISVSLRSKQQQQQVQFTTQPQAQQQSSSQRYRQQSQKQHYKDDVLWAIVVARRRLQKTRDFVHILGAQMLIITTDDDPDDADQDDMMMMMMMGEGQYYNYDKRRISNILNLMSTFLHLTDYYVVAPGCGAYAMKMGGTASLAGMIIGMNSVAALMSTILYSWWTSYSYKAPLLCATTCQIIGEIIYALALPWGGSLKLIMLGRFFSGLGSARALNRRYIADTYPARERTAASAAFVTAGALGTSAGPAFAACLYLVVPESSTNPYWQVENAPCWFMALIWTVYLALIIYFFEEPPRPSSQQVEVAKMNFSQRSERLALLKNDAQKDEKAGSNVSDSSQSFSTQPLWQNVPVMTTFVIYFVLKFILESLLSSTATLTGLYFDWSGSLSGTYLAMLGFLVLPANWLVALLAPSYDDRELILAIECFMLAGCLAILKYTSRYFTAQYVIGSIVIFVSTNALEGPTMSLLSKTIPSVYSRGLLNVGLLATEAGTLGRAVGDVMLTMCGSSGLEYILNNAFGFMSALAVFTIGVTRYFYHALEPLEKDD